MSAVQPDGRLYVGVDGGGSRCRVRLRDAGGQILRTAEGGTANVYLDFDAAIRTIRDCVEQSLRSVRDVADVSVLHFGLGLAGVSSPEIAERVRMSLPPLGTMAVTFDGDIACLGAHGGQDGGLIIAGTGSAAVARIGGQSCRLGGRGFIMGDEGSGARLGLDALRRSLRAFDGFEPRTPLTDGLMARFENDPIQLIQWARSARSSDFGQFAPAVFSAASDGDPVGLSLVTASAAAITELADALLQRGAPRVAMVGGLSAVLVRYLPATIQAHLTQPMFDALDGALILAGCPTVAMGGSPVVHRGGAT